MKSVRKSNDEAFIVQLEMYSTRNIQLGISKRENRMSKHIGRYSSCSNTFRMLFQTL